MYEEYGSIDSVEEYIEVQGVRKFKSNEYLDNLEVDNTETKKVSEKIEVTIEEKENDPGYNESDEGEDAVIK